MFQGCICNSHADLVYAAANMRRLMLAARLTPTGHGCPSPTTTMWGIWGGSPDGLESEMADSLFMRSQTDLGASYSGTLGLS